MFGYVTVYKDELKLCEYNLFRSYYCGLCKQIGTHSQAARLGLSYDMTFLAILLSSVSDEPLTVIQKRCVAHPLKKRGNVIGDRAVAYSADMSILLSYLKLEDDWKDDRDVKARIAMTAYSRSIARIKQRYPKQCAEILRCLDSLGRLEQENCSEIDKPADCFAKILSILFTPDFIKDEYTRRCLSWLGYNTGRWIYIIDAYHDIEKDAKKHSYNPFLPHADSDISALREHLRQELDVTLTYTLNHIASSYELLRVYKNDGILRNILYLGLKIKQDSILKGKAGTTNEPV